jgi:hypothetical protein
MTQISNSWLGTNANGDVWVQNDGPCSINASTISSNTMAFPINNYGNLSLDGVNFSAGGSITACVNNESGFGTLTWSNVGTGGHPLYAVGGTAVITAAQALGQGSSTGMSPGAGTVGTAAGNQIWQGSGVPVNANGANGDIYFRTDTPATSSQRIYIRSAGAWVALVV